MTRRRFRCESERAECITEYDREHFELCMGRYFRRFECRTGLRRAGGRCTLCGGPSLLKTDRQRHCPDTEMRLGRWPAQPGAARPKLVSNVKRAGARKWPSRGQMEHSGVASRPPCRAGTSSSRNNGLLATSCRCTIDGPGGPRLHPRIVCHAGPDATRVRNKIPRLQEPRMKLAASSQVWCLPNS